MARFGRSKAKHSTGGSAATGGGPGALSTPGALGAAPTAEWAHAVAPNTSSDGEVVEPKAARGNRTLPILAAVAVLSLAAGFGLSRLIVNPAEVAARTAPPAAGLITVPIEHRTLSNDVTLRGDVQFDAATQVQIETGELTTRAVVTGAVPEAGSELTAGSVALEVNGRPVIVLPGTLPTFRTLRVGMSGPDVIQLKEALAALGIPAGDPTSDMFDEATAAGVAALFRHVGFRLPEQPAATAESLSAAQQRVLDAENAVRRAERAANSGPSGPNQLEWTQAEAAIVAAERNWQMAHAALEDMRLNCGTEERECSALDFQRAQAGVDDAADAVRLAITARNQLYVPPDNSAARDAVADAHLDLAQARSMLSDVEHEALPFLPASEVIFFDALPRRVDAVNVQRGDDLPDGPAMVVSGADLMVTATAAAADVALLEIGSTALIDRDGVSVDATVTEIKAPEDVASGRSTILLTPRDLTPDELTHFRGSNVRVTIPVSSTGGDVLSVPLAALTAGPGGEARIEIKHDDGTTELVEVTTGLAAGGHVEVTGVGRLLQPGDLVVIGTGGSAATETDA